MEPDSIDRNNCFDPRIGLVPVSEAQKSILEQIIPLTSSEVVKLPEALDRIAASSIPSNINVPPHSNSAMDGFAIAAERLPKDGEKSFRIAGTALAGKPWMHKCGKDEVVRVMTGAVMPENTDTVIIQEDAATEGDHAIITPGHTPYQNVRHAGEDLKRNQTAIEGGTRIGAAELGVLASIGVGRVEVVRRPVVAVFSTGDELKNAGEPLPIGGIYDSNRYVIMGLLQRTGLSVINLGIIPDDETSTLDALQQASKKADVIITSGGVSTGSADFVIKALEQLGQVDLWRIAIRPGRPFAFGRIGQSSFFGLPGNPVAVMVTFFRLVQPALRKLMGQSDLYPVPVMQARAATRFRKKPNRCEVYRAILSYDENGIPVVSSTGQQGSGLLHSMSEANCFVLLDDDEVSVEPGDMVSVQLFEGLN